MIRRSAGLAAGALVLSIFVHVFGLELTFDMNPDPPPPAGAEEAVALGNGFEEIADVVLEPVEPEPPEPEAETPPSPEEAETPTSEVLVASPNPQNTPSPDSGLTPPVSEDVTTPVEPSSVQPPTADDPAASGGNAEAVADARLAAPEDTTDESGGDPLGAVEPPAAAASTEPQTADTTLAPVPVQPEVTPPVPDVIAALPQTTTAPSPDNVTAPVETQDEAVEPDQPGNALTSSLRPKTRSQDPLSEKDSLFGQADQLEGLRNSNETIESPLTLYARDGIDLFGGQERESQSQGRNSGGGLGPGNADVTNYNGQVLMHLNRTRSIAVKARGWARVFFRINPDGTLGSVGIVDSSGSDEIDRAAKAQVRSGVPFPRPPGGKSRSLSFVYRPN